MAAGNDPRVNGGGLVGVRPPRLKASDTRPGTVKIHEDGKVVDLSSLVPNGATEQERAFAEKVLLATGYTPVTVGGTVHYLTDEDFSRFFAAQQVAEKAKSAFHPKPRADAALTRTVVGKPDAKPVASPRDPVAPRGFRGTGANPSEPAPVFQSRGVRLPILQAGDLKPGSLPVIEGSDAGVIESVIPQNDFAARILLAKGLIPVKHGGQEHYLTPGNFDRYYAATNGR